MIASRGLKKISWLNLFCMGIIVSSLFFGSGVQEVSAAQCYCAPADQYIQCDVCSGDVNDCTCKVEASGVPNNGGNNGGSTTRDVEEETLDDPLTAEEEEKLEDYTKSGTEVLVEVIVNVISWIRGISLALAVLMVVVAGFIYLTSAGSQRISYATKMITGVAVGLLIIFSASSIIIEVLSAIGGNTSNANNALQGISGGSDFKTTVRSIATIFSGLIGAIGTLMLIIGGIMYLTSAGNQGRMDLAKNIITYSVIGIAVALLAWSIVSFIYSVVT